MRHGKGLRVGSLKRRSAIRRGGFRTPRAGSIVRRRRTGPTAKVRALVTARCGGLCEWPGCRRHAVDLHHRLSRKAGGRHGAGRERINQAGWLLGVCRRHHERVTSPAGRLRSSVQRMGWLLREHEDALSSPVVTRHRPEPVLLDNAGGWDLASDARSSVRGGHREDGHD